jgi:predicted Zn-dependent protease
MKLISFYPLVLSVVFLQGCQTNPVTGRKSLSLVPASEMQSMSYSEYGTFLKSHTLSTNAEQTAMVTRVGTRIQKAVENYMAQNGKSSELAGFKWEFHLVEDPEVNAWCMPGGKVVVYTGIMPVVQNETALAVVLGHEIGHAIANHGGERMSQGMVQQFGGVALSVALSSKPAQTKALFAQAYNTGTQVAVLLPYSRLDESEADRMGLIFMSMAGYNPDEAVTFWQRMKASSAGGQKPSVLTSTHPSDDKRISDIQKWLPEVKEKYYKPQ